MKTAQESCQYSTVTETASLIQDFVSNTCILHSLQLVEPCYLTKLVEDVTLNSCTVVNCSYSRIINIAMNYQCLLGTCLCGIGRKIEMNRL